MTTDGSPPTDPGPRLQLLLLGPMSIHRDGAALALPTSRKVRALIAYLALATRDTTRAHLCELLGDVVPNDPRGELRWCLSKARAVLDDPGRRRIKTTHDTVRLDLHDCYVDVAEVGRAMHTGVHGLGADRLRALSDLFAGDFLDGLEIERSPHFIGWLMAQRRRLRACRIAVLEQLVANVADGSEEAIGCLEKWLGLAPFDQRAHELLLNALARHHRLRDGEEHLAATERLFEAEGLDLRPIRDAWISARARHAAAPLASQAAPADATPAPSIDFAVESAVPQRRASIAVMPFADRVGNGVDRGGLANGFAHDLITRLAKLRSLFVIAQGTVFALDERSVGAEEAGRTLNVDYVVSGAMRRQGKRVLVNVELAETRSAHIVWAEAFDRTLDDAFLVLDEIGNRIVASIASEIETVERNRAILRPPTSLDAWEAHHRGLWHMYRFNRDDNERARHFFEMAVRLDPTFSRAHAGLSFTHFQSAFQQWDEREPAIARAFESAGQSLLADDRDPAAHWAMGRALWLRGRQDAALVELSTAVELSPNFALGHYTLAFVQCQSGDAQAAIDASDHSRQLSPYDPLLFGMLGARAMALVRLRRFDEAADWAVKAAARPNAHAHIRAIAAHCLALAGRLDEGRAYTEAIHATLPAYRTDDFLAAFRFDPDAVALFRKGAAQLEIG